MGAAALVTVYSAQAVAVAIGAGGSSSCTASGGSWCQRWQWLLMATGGGEVGSNRDGNSGCENAKEGRKTKYVNSQPLPSFYKLKKVAEESFPPNFAIIANLSQTCFTTCKSNFQYLNIKYIRIKIIILNFT